MNKTEQIRISAYKNEHLDEGSQWTIADRLLWYEYRELYQRFRGSLIDQKQAEAEKNRIMQRYDTALAVQEMSDRVFQAQSDLWKRIEPAADRYRLNRTVENADAFIEAVYSVQSKKQLNQHTTQRRQNTTDTNDEYILRGTNIYDEIEIHENCTVQILRNSVTGETSIGWWDNEPDGAGPEHLPS